MEDDQRLKVVLKLFLEVKEEISILRLVLAEAGLASQAVIGAARKKLLPAFEPTRKALLGLETLDAEELGRVLLDLDRVGK